MFGLKKHWWSPAILRISSCTRDGFSCVYIKQQSVNVAGSSAESYCNTGINRGVGTTSLSETYIYKTQVFSSLRHGTCPVRALPFAASSRCQTRSNLALKHRFRTRHTHHTQSCCFSVCQPVAPPIPLPHWGRGRRACRLTAPRRSSPKPPPHWCFPGSRRLR